MGGGASLGWGLLGEWAWGFGRWAGLVCMGVAWGRGRAWLGQGGLWGEWGLNGTGAPREGFGGPRRGQGSIGGTEVPSGGSLKPRGLGEPLGSHSSGGRVQLGGLGRPLGVRAPWPGCGGRETLCWGLRGTRGPGGVRILCSFGGAAGRGEAMDGGASITWGPSGGLQGGSGSLGLPGQG